MVDECEDIFSSNSALKDLVRSKIEIPLKQSHKLTTFALLEESAFSTFSEADSRWLPSFFFFFKLSYSFQVLAVSHNPLRQFCLYTFHLGESWQSSNVGFLENKVISRNRFPSTLLTYQFQHLPRRIMTGESLEQKA